MSPRQLEPYRTEDCRAIEQAESIGFDILPRKAAKPGPCSCGTERFCHWCRAIDIYMAEHGDLAAHFLRQQVVDWARGSRE
jgi:hypothetical protein